MKTKFKVLLKQFCTESSVLGLKYFYIYPDKLTICFWTVATLCSFVFAMSLTQDLWLRFQQQPTRISIETQFANINGLPYPAITVCSPNQISGERVTHFKKTLVDGNNTGLDFQAILPQLLGYNELVPFLDDERLGQLHRLIVQNRYTVREVMSIIPQPCDKFIKLCIFELRRADCKKLFRPILTRYGLCCSFNSPYLLWENTLNYKEHNFTPIHPQKNPQLLAGLTIVIDSNTEDALNKTLLNGGGIRVMIHDWTEFPSDDESFVIYPHVESFQMIKGVRTYCSDDVAALATENRKCVFSHESDKGLLKDFYRNSDCDWMCTVNAIMKHCHCWLLSAPGFHSRLCNFTDIKCIIETKRYLAESDYMASNCDCPRDCDSREYRVDVNVGNLGAIPYLANNPFKGVQFNKSTALLHFVFKNNFYVVQKQETIMSFVNLTSNLGGVFGLCLGWSLLSGLEILVFIYRVLKNLILSCRRRKTLHHQR